MVATLCASGGADKDPVRGMKRIAPHVRHMTIPPHDFPRTAWGLSKDLVT